MHDNKSCGFGSDTPCQKNAHTRIFACNSTFLTSTFIIMELNSGSDSTKYDGFTTPTKAKVQGAVKYAQAKGILHSKQNGFDFFWREKDSRLCYA